MKRTALITYIPVQEPPKRESGYVIAKSQIASYDGQTYLNIDLFYKGELKGRYFADKLTYACYVEGSWRTCKMDNVARICIGKPALKGNELYYHETEWEWDSDADERTARGYLGKSLDYYENTINQEKYMNALKRKENRIAEMMNRVPVLPDELELWLNEKIYPENYLFLKKGKRTDYSCTACGAKSWTKGKWKHNEKTTCPKCGKPVIAYSKKPEIEKKAPVVVLQTMGEYEWVERQLRTCCTWTTEGKQIKTFEEIRVIIPKGKTWGKVWYGTYLGADEYEQDFWDHNQRNKRFMESYLYPGTLQNTMPYMGALQHSGLEIIASIPQKINVNNFITTFTGRTWLEYWIKSGLTNLAAEVVNAYGMWGNPRNIKQNEKKLTENLQINGNRLQRLKKMNGGLNALQWLQYEQRELDPEKQKISQESLEFLDRRNVDPDTCTEILNCLGSANRMVNYMKKQKIAPNSIITTWKDYLRMARSEGLDITDDIVRLPKDLKARHDELLEIINERNNAEKARKEKEKYEKLNQNIMRHLPEAKRYYWESKDYMIIPAGTCQELMEEGKTLHHCVGASDRYMKKMADGESWILFLRKRTELEKPYYTIEINMADDKILQWYSEYDRKPDEKKIQKVLSAFKNGIKRQPERIRVAG